MNDQQIIEEFQNTWKYIRSMTDAFINCVPENKWKFSHHPKFAPLAKQFKHVIKVYGCYVDALANNKLDMSKKKTLFTGNESHKNILKQLKQTDEKLNADGIYRIHSHHHST